MAECTNCESWCGDDYDYCRECSNEEIPVVFESIDTLLPNSWVFLIRGEKVQLPFSQCTLDEPKLKVWVPRWLATKKEIDYAA